MNRIMQGALMSWGLLMTAQAMALPTLADTCTVAEPTQAPGDFMWGLVAYHVPLPGYELYPEDFQKMAANGIKWISVDFTWKRIEPTQGAQYDFSYFDMLTQEAAKNGIQIIGKLANGYNTQNRAVSPEWTASLSADDFIGVMDKYARAVVQRYGQTVKYWAMENELNLDVVHVALGWRAHPWTPAVKDRIIATLNQAIHESAPGTRSILTVSTIPTYQIFLKHMSSIVNYDMVGLFSYPANFLPITQGFDNTICQTALTSRQNSGNKPVIWLETGFQTEGPGRTPQAQAQYVSSAARAALRAGLNGMFIYQYLDNPDEQLPRERSFGLFEADRTAKPAWAAYGAAISKYSAP